MKILLVLSSLLVELFAFSRWYSCSHFTNIFYYTTTDLIQRVIGGINDDYGIPHILTHIMHNKATYFLWGYTQGILQYWDIRFLKEFIGIIGAIGMYLAVWYLISKHRNNKHILLVFIICIVFACIEIFFDLNIQFPLKLFLFGIPYIILSLFGILQFLEGKRTHIRYIFIIIVLALSIATILLLPQSLAYQSFCS